MAFEFLTRRLELTSLRKEEALMYLEKHRLLDLLVNLTSSLLFHRPEKPRDFLLNMLARIKIAKITTVDFPYLMDDSNLVSMFEIMDPTNQGFITPVQYREALKNLGLLGPDEVIDEDREVITREDFRDDVNKRTLKMWSAF
ncbi:EF-hand calcium-binding domain-containing protein 10 isoform X1 [Phascolarctos cinereus]|uniref:EF-hand calcium-binding domain-containing protein 10-like isoform X1 n=1 Tax=Phascolarctos cinereus TaxID=38626 RepID=A0A6P5K697_PHACI|nr:EF-hand calcium-binding domain-containing protein 10-like isoform X1 [Phascolarctos cinereus]